MKPNKNWTWLLPPDDGGATGINACPTAPPALVELGATNAAEPSSHRSPPPNAAETTTTPAVLTSTLTTVFGNLKKLAAASKGVRNDTLNRAAFALGKLVGRKEIARADAERELERHAHAIGLDVGETQRTVKSGLDAGAKNAPLPPPPWAPTVWTPAKLATTDFPEPTWLVPNLLPEGGLIILAGRPKVGKSWLALLWASLISGAVYIGLEDGPRRLKARAKALELAENNPELWTDPPPRCPEGLDALAAEITSRDPRPPAVFIDPWARFAPATKGNQRVYETDYEAVAAVKKVADDLDVTIVLVHHTRKPTMGGQRDVVDEILGSTALSGGPDALLILKRGRNTGEGTLFVTGRDIEESEKALTFKTGRWEVLGDAREVAASEERREVQELLRKAGALRAKEVADMLGKPVATIRALLWKMYKDGDIIRPEKGKYEAPDKESVDYAPF